MPPNFMIFLCEETRSASLKHHPQTEGEKSTPPPKTQFVSCISVQVISSCGIIFCKFVISLLADLLLQRTFFSEVQG